MDIESRAANGTNGRADGRTDGWTKRDEKERERERDRSSENVVHAGATKFGPRNEGERKGERKDRAEEIRGSIGGNG